MPLTRDQAMRAFMAQQSMLRGYLAAFCGDPHVVEDVLQDVSVVVLEQHQDVRDAESFPAWLRGVARHKAHQRFRSMRRHGRVMDDALLDAMEGDWGEEDSEDPHPRLEALRRCMEQLSARMRRMLALRFDRGLGCEDIARTLKVPVNTVYVGISRSYRRLAECIRLHTAGAEQ